MTNTRKLRAAMVERGYTQVTLADAINISPQSMNKKMNNKGEFKASEIEAICRILNIRNMHEIFFADEVS